MTPQHQPQMSKAGELLSRCAANLAALSEDLHQAIRLLDEIRNDMGQSAVLAQEYLMVAGIDEPFLLQLFGTIDPAIFATIIRQLPPAKQRDYQDCMDFLCNPTGSKRRSRQ